MKHRKKLEKLIKEYEDLGISKQPGYMERTIQDLVDSSIGLTMLDEEDDKHRNFLYDENGNEVLPCSDKKKDEKDK